ncbi:MAG: calcium-binding protein [Leptolyngbyaceae cyanobacterium]
MGVKSCGIIGNNTLQGGRDNDQLFGARGNDILNGEEGNDTLIGGGSNDILDGGLGDDIVNGGRQNDRVYGGESPFFSLNKTAIVYNGFGQLADISNINDTLIGGTGADTFVYKEGDAADLITDFEDGVDTLEILTSSFNYSLRQATNGTFVDFGEGQGVFVANTSFSELFDDVIVISN